jgi:hypothetical protein
MAWVEGWDDEAAMFLTTFGDQPPETLHAGDEDEEEKPFELVDRGEKRKREVPVRDGQQKFKFLVVKRYGACCAVCKVNAFQGRRPRSPPHEIVHNVSLLKLPVAGRPWVTRSSGSARSRDPGARGPSLVQPCVTGALSRRTRVGSTSESTGPPCGRHRAEVSATEREVAQHRHRQVLERDESRTT